MRNRTSTRGPQRCNQNSSLSFFDLTQFLLGAVFIGTIGTALRGSCAETNAAPPLVSAQSASQPLLDLLLQKGLITQEEASKVQAEVDAMHTNAPATSDSKWKIGKSIKNLELYGDVRFRFEDRAAEDPTGGRIDLERYRYSVRFGVRGDLFDDFYFGLRLDTSSNPRSPWVTFGTSTTPSGSSVYSGPFGKSTAGIFVGQAYIGWHPQDWLDLEIGKMPNPIYTTPMIWSPNINPEGLSERFKYSVGEADFFANFAQFIYMDANPNQFPPGYYGTGGSLFPSIGGGSSGASFLLAWQGGFNYHFTKKTTLKLAPVLYDYAGHPVNTTANASFESPGFGNVYVGQGATNGVNGVPASGWSGFPTGPYGGYNANQTGINDLLVLDIPAEVNFKLEDVNLRFFGDYAINLKGQQRAEAAFQASTAPTLPEVGGIAPIKSAQTQDIHAYQIGVGIGSANIHYGPHDGLVYGSDSKRNTWEFRTYWQHVEQYSLDPNLIDTDFFQGVENLQGIYAALAYGVTENIIGTARYGHASRINDQLGTGGSGQDIPQMNPVQTYNLFQIDVTFRF